LLGLVGGQCELAALWIAMLFYSPMATSSDSSAPAGSRNRPVDSPLVAVPRDIRQDLGPP